MGSTKCVRCGETAYTTDKSTLFDWMDREGWYCPSCGIVWWESED